MKIRTDFVTNSSSSSFVIALEIETEKGENCTLASFDKCCFGEGYEGTKTIGSKSVCGEPGWCDPDDSFGLESPQFSDEDAEDLLGEDMWDYEYERTEEDMYWIDILCGAGISDVERVLKKMIAGTPITNEDEKAIKSLIEGTLEKNSISVGDIDTYTIFEELELSGDNDIMQPLDFLKWEDALDEAKDTDIEVLARRYHTDVESMQIFLDMDGHTYLTQRERITKVKTGETFLRHIIYPTIYKDSRDTNPIPVTFSSDGTGIFARTEDFEVVDGVLVKYLMRGDSRVVIPQGLGIKSIGNSVFKENNVILSVTIPDGVEEIGDSAFYFARNLKEIVLPSTLKRIGNNAFCGCESLEKIELPDGLLEIANGAFAYTGLSELHIPDSVERLDTDDDSLSISGILSNSKIKHFEFPSWCTEVPDNMFSFCKNLETVVLPKGLTKIGSSAFSDCSSLVSIELPSNLKEIGWGAFSNTAISSISIPSSLVEIGGNCFEESKLKELSLPSSLTELPAWLCANCKQLSTVSWGDNIRVIQEYAFYGCGRLKHLPAFANVEEVGTNAFAGCKSLTEIDLGNHLEKMGSLVFSGDKRLKRLTIPGTVVIMGGRMTLDTSEDIVVHFENTSGWLKHTTFKDARAGIKGKPIDFSDDSVNADLLSKKVFYSCTTPKKHV